MIAFSLLSCRLNIDAHLTKFEMMSTRKSEVSFYASRLPKSELIFQFVEALRMECYLYAGILHNEIKNRNFTHEEVEYLRNSEIYPRLNGVI